METILLVSAKEKAKMGGFPCNQAENLVDNKMDLAQLLKLQAISKSTLYSRFNLLLILSCLHKCLHKLHKVRELIIKRIERGDDSGLLVLLVLLSIKYNFLPQTSQ